MTKKQVLFFALARSFKSHFLWSFFHPGSNLRTKSIWWRKGQKTTTKEWQKVNFEIRVKQFLMQGTKKWYHKVRNTLHHFKHFFSLGVKGWLPNGTKNSHRDKKDFKNFPGINCFWEIVILQIISVNVQLNVYIFYKWSLQHRQVSFLFRAKCSMFDHVYDKNQEW